MQDQEVHLHLPKNYHYILIKHDYSDLLEKRAYYLQNMNEALEIIKNAQEWTQQFRNNKTEKELSIKVLPKPETSKTLIIKNPHLKKALDFLGKALSSSTDPSGGVFYPDYFGKDFVLNDLTHDGGLTAIRIEGPTNSVDQRANRLSKELGLLDQELSILDNEQSNIFWSRTKNLEVFKSLKSNLLRMVLPVSETLQVIQKLKSYDIKYFIDWGGGLIWASFDQLNTKILSEIKDTVKKHQGYITLIKVEEDLKASADIFTIDPIKYKISEKIKRSFDPKRIFNPGKMYTGI